MVAFVKTVIVIGLWIVLIGAMAVDYTHKPAPYDPPAYCYDSEDNFKSDVCSKIGKTCAL